MNDVTTGKRFERFVDIVRKLRHPTEGCPWDLKQTHESLLQYLIEEAYEYIEAVESNPSEMPKELGDVLLQVVLHSQLASERGTFSIDTVIDEISKKMIERHPHVFAGAPASSAEEVTQNWERNKKKSMPDGKSIVDGVPRAVPALQRAQRISEKAARVGFEWRTVEDVRDKVTEEIGEFLEVSCSPTADDARRRDELGDVFFALVQLARRLGYEAETLLNKSTDKFVHRFKRMESLAKGPLEALSLESMDALWEKAKSEEPKT